VGDGHAPRRGRLLRTGRVGWAIVLAGLGQATHAAVVVPIAALLVVAWLSFEPHRRRLLLAYAASLVIAAPAIVLVFLTPAFTDAALGVKVGTSSGRSHRGCSCRDPVALGGLRRDASVDLPVLLVVSSAQCRRSPSCPMPHRVHDLSVSPEHGSCRTSSRRPFDPTRVPRPRHDDRRIGMYQVIQHGGRLDRSSSRRAWSAVRGRAPVEYCVPALARGRSGHRVLRLRRPAGKNEQKLFRLLSSSQRNACRAVG